MSWVSAKTPHNFAIAPTTGYDRNGQWKESDMARFSSSVKVITGDVPRKYREKRLLRKNLAGRNVRLWPYLPFYTHKSTRVVVTNPSTIAPGQLLPCQPPNNGIRACVCSNNNGWKSSLPANYPPVDHTAINPYGSPEMYQFEEGEFVEDTLRRASKENLTLLAKRGLAALESALSNFPDMLVIFSELRELPELFATPDSIGNAYLWNQFGLQPTAGALVDVVVGAVHRWNDATGFKKLTVRQTVKGGLVTTHGGIPSRDSCCWGGPSQCLRGYENKVTKSDSALYTLELIYTYTPPAWGLAMLNKLDEFLTRVNALGDVSTLWEMTPFSWMVDWLLPIGDILKGMSAYAGMGKWNGFTVHDGYISIKRNKSTRSLIEVLACQAGVTEITQSDECYVRIPLRNPWEWLNFLADTSSVPRSISQLLTIAALVWK